MASKRVAVLGTNNLLVTGIATMLGEQPCLEVCTFDAHSDDLKSQLSAFSPDVAVVDGTDADCTGSYPLESLLRADLDVTIIVLSLESPQLRVYRHRSVTVADSNDLLELITAGDP